MELDLISLKGNAVSSSSYGGVYGFSMSLGSPSGFGSVRHVYFHSHFKVVLLEYLHCCQPPTCPLNLCQCFCSLVLPCTARQSLLGRGLCGPFLGSPRPCPLHCRDLCGLPSALWTLPLCHGACLHLSWPPRPSLWVTGLLCICLSSPGPLSASWGLYALVSDHQTQPLCHGACVLVVLACQPTLYVVGAGGGEGRAGVFFFHLPVLTLCTLRFVCTAEVCMPWLSWAHPLCHEGCVCWSGLYAVRLLAPRALQSAAGASVGFSQFPKPAVSSGPQSMSSLQAEKCSFLCFLPSKSLLCLVFQDSTAPLWTQLWGSFPVHGNSSGFRTPSFPRVTSSCPEVLHLLPFYGYILSPASFQGA